MNPNTESNNAKSQKHYIGIGCGAGFGVAIGASLHKAKVNNF